MKLTPAQFRDAIGITQETLRHWRKVLPIFQGRAGYAPVFTTGDLVAGAIIKTLKDTCGISIAKFADQSISIGKICNETPWATLSNAVLVLSLSDSTCAIVASKAGLQADQLSLTVPLGPVMDHLTQAMLQSSDQTQHPIYFPPTEIGARKRKTGTE